MHDWSRRAFLAGGVAGLSAVAGCSNVPVVGDSNEHPDYDFRLLREQAEPGAVSEVAPYLGPVPNTLADAHFERGQSLLDGVPADPSFPNEVIADRLADQRERVAEAFTEPPADVSTVGTLGGWRADRVAAAELSAAFHAANGDMTSGDVVERRTAVRSDLAAFRDDWAYRGNSVVAAVAVHRYLERLVAITRRSLLNHAQVADDVQAAVFDVGEYVGNLEEGRAAAADALGLRDAYATDEMASYVDEITVAASRLERVIPATQRRVPDIAPESSIDDFYRDIEGTPAAELFRQARRAVIRAPRLADDESERGEYARAVVGSGHALVELLAAEAAVEAIRDGKYGLPESTDVVVAARERALDAVDGTWTADRSPVASVVAFPARRALQDAEYALGGREPQTDDWTPDYSDVHQAVGRYAYAVYAADAVPAVVERVVSELRAGE